MARESSLQQRLRQDEEKSKVRVSRQVRLGHIPAPEVEKPKAPAKPRARTTAAKKPAAKSTAAKKPAAKKPK